MTEERKKAAHGVMLDLGCAEDELAAALLESDRAKERVARAKSALEKLHRRIEGALVHGEL